MIVSVLWARQRQVAHLCKAPQPRGFVFEAPLCRHGRFIWAKAVALAGKRPGISFHAVVTEKSNVNRALSQKTEALYNHMAEQMLAGEMAQSSRIDFYPDARTVKPKDKHALHNYLETRLAIAGSNPLITTTPSESGAFFQIQCADILASIVWAKYEYGSPVFDAYLAHTVNVTKLF